MAPVISVFGNSKGWLMPSDHHYELAVRISIEALKALILVTGGAAGAMVAWMARGASSSWIEWSAVAFGCSAIMASVTMAVGYVAQLSYAKHVHASENGDTEGSVREHRRHEYQMKIAWTFFASAVLAALGGLVLAIMGAAR